MMRYLIPLIALLASGCVMKAGPVVVGIGQVESCEGDYSYDDATGRWRCRGAYVAGAAISDAGSRAVGGAVDTVRSSAAAVFGLPSPPKATGP